MTLTLEAVASQLLLLLLLMVGVGTARCVWIPICSLRAGTTMHMLLLLGPCYNPTYLKEVRRGEEDMVVLQAEEAR